MLSHGDELDRTQRGNNNVYAQDNEISWVHWDLTPDQHQLLAFTSAVIALRLQHPSSAAVVSSAGMRCMVEKAIWATSSGSSPTGPTWMRRTGTQALPGALWSS